MIIDFHTHVFPEKIAAPTIAALSERASIPPHSDGTVEGLLRDMRRGGVDIAVNLPVVTRYAQFDSVNAFARSINDREYEPHSPKIISFAGIHPDEPEPERRMEEIRELGFLGIKIHPDYQGHFIDDEAYIRILSLAKKYGLITVTHAGLDAAYVGEEIKCTPKRVLRLLDALGGYDRLVLAHMGGRELFDEVYSLLAGEDIYFDTAYVLSEIDRDMLEKIIERHTPSRILFASDSPWQNTTEVARRLRAFALGKDAEDKIFYQNAKKLLGIN